MNGEDTLKQILVDIRDILQEILYSIKPVGRNIEDLVYERVASTLTDPVPANAKDYPLIEWYEPRNRGQIFLLYGLGTDQHDNSYYKWIFDNVVVYQLSGPARVGSIFEPFIFPKPIKVINSICLYIDNNNDVAYPNDSGLHPSDIIPYEAVFFGYWR